MTVWTTAQEGGSQTARGSVARGRLEVRWQRRGTKRNGVSLGAEWQQTRAKERPCISLRFGCNSATGSCLLSAVPQGP